MRTLLDPLMVKKKSTPQAAQRISLNEVDHAVVVDILRIISRAAPEKRVAILEQATRALGLLEGFDNAFASFRARAVNVPDVRPVRGEPRRPKRVKR